MGRNYFGFCALFVFLQFVLLCHCESNNRVLVLLDNLSSQQRYSIFFNDLKDRGYKLSFFAADDPALTLLEYGEYLYDQMVIFAPNVEEFGGLIDVPSILDFIDEGHNVLIGADSSVSDPVREIAVECGIEFDDEASYVIDHFHAADSSIVGDHSAVAIEADKETILDTPIVTGDKPFSERKPVIFEGIAQSINTANGLNFAVMRGYDTTYSANPSASIKSAHTGQIGKSTTLISVLQARNNARVLVSGSLVLFSDRFSTSQTENRYFASELSKWTFKERGILRATNITHHRLDEEVPPPMYTIKDNITYSVIIEEWNGKNWVPFVSNNVQLEFTMLDPYVRIPLKHNNKGLYSITFKAPDVYGVFSFKVNYHHIGYSSLSLKTIYPVRPFRHDEYERFIKTANPYYLSSLSMLAGVVILTVFLLFTY